MRNFSLVHDIEGSADDYWRLFLHLEYERNLYYEGFRFPSYEILYNEEDEAGLRRKIAVQPKLDMPPAVAKLFGKSFAYVEEQSYDKALRVYCARMTPNGLGDRLTSEVVVRTEPTADGRCQRVCEIFIEAKLFGLGPIVEMAVEKNVRQAWAMSAGYLNKKLQASLRFEDRLSPSYL